LRFGTHQHCGPIPAGEHAARQSPVLIWHRLFAEWRDPSAVSDWPHALPACRAPAD